MADLIGVKLERGMRGHACKIDDVEGLIKDAMRRAYDIADLPKVEAREPTSEEAALSKKLFTAFDKIEKAVDAAKARQEANNPDVFSRSLSGASQKGDHATQQRGDHKIKELRERISELLSEGECHNESGVFRLEREIWELQHPPEEEDSILDSEFIGGRGFTNREGGAQ